VAEPLAHFVKLRNKRALARREIRELLFLFNRRTHGFSFLFFFPAALIQLIAGPEGAKNLAGEMSSA